MNGGARRRTGPQWVVFGWLPAVVCLRARARAQVWAFDLAARRVAVRRRALGGHRGQHNGHAGASTVARRCTRSALGPIRQRPRGTVRPYVCKCACRTRGGGACAGRQGRPRLTLLPCPAPGVSDQARARHLAMRVPTGQMGRCGDPRLSRHTGAGTVDARLPQHCREIFPAFRPVRESRRGSSAGARRIALPTVC